ncbi:hypothetical protein ACSVDA_22130 [Cytobacillus sp. Hm23]
MHKIEEHLVLLSSSGFSKNLSVDTEEYYRKLLNEYRESFSILDYFLNSSTARIMESSLFEANISIFDNKCVRILPNAKLVKHEKISTKADELLSFLKGVDLSDKHIGHILADLKFDFGYFIDKGTDVASVLVTEKLISIKYKDVTKYDMTKINPGIKKLLENTSFNFGGHHAIELLSSMGCFELEQFDLGDNLSEIRLSVLNNTINLDQAILYVPLNSLRYLRDPIELNRMLKLPSQNFPMDYTGFESLSDHDQLVTAISGFILETITNIQSHNYKDYDYINVLWFENFSSPFLVPDGYTEGLDI